MWSLQVPGSDSSPLTRTYFGFSDVFGTNDHFMPVGKPAPPRPRSPDAFMVLMIHSGTFCDRLLDGLVAVELNVLVDVRSALAEPAGEHSNFVGMRDQGRHYFSSFPLPSRYIWKIASTFAGVRFSWKS